MGKESTLPEAPHHLRGRWAMPQQKLPQQLYRSQQLAQESLRIGELGPSASKLTHPFPTAMSTLCVSPGEESKGEAGTTVPIHALEQQETARCAEPGGAPRCCQTVHAPQKESRSSPAALQVHHVAAVSMGSLPELVPTRLHSTLAWPPASLCPPPRTSMFWGVLRLGP